MAPELQNQFTLLDRWRHLPNYQLERRADVFFAPGPLKLGDLFQIYQRIDLPRLKDKPFNPRISAQLASSEDIFSIIRRG